MCLNRMVDPDTDLLLIDYVTTDATDLQRNESLFHNERARTYERLLRKALQMEKQPAVVMLQARPHTPSPPHTVTRAARMHACISLQVHSHPGMHARISLKPNRAQSPVHACMHACARTRERTHANVDSHAHTGTHAHTCMHAHKYT